MKRKEIGRLKVLDIYAPVAFYFNNLMRFLTPALRGAIGMTI